MSSIAKLAVVAALDYPYRETAKALSCERLPTIPVTHKGLTSTWKTTQRAISQVDRLSRYAVEKNYVRYLAQRCQSAPTVSLPKRPERRRSGRRGPIPHSWDVYPWHGYYRDGSSVRCTNENSRRNEPVIEHRTLHVKTGHAKYDTKPKNWQKKSVVMSRRAVPFQVVETAI